MTQFEKKLVAVMNKSVEPGRVMNALAHASIAFGSKIGSEELQLVDYVDRDGEVYPNISKMPFIVLRAGSNKIRKLRELAVDRGVDWIAFTDTMTIGSWDEQVERTKETPSEDLVFFGVVLFGPHAEVAELTKKFSLWR